MKDTNRYFKVKYGYSVADQVSIGEGELEKAIYAQIVGQPVQLDKKYINGRNIIAIEPHYHKHTGWYDYYEPESGEDWEQIKRDCPPYDGIVAYYKERVNYLLHQNKKELIGKNVDIPELKMPEPKQIENGRISGMKSIGDLLN